MRTAGDALRDIAFRQRNLAKAAAWRYATSSEAEMDRWETLARQYLATEGVTLDGWADRMRLDPVDLWAVTRVVERYQRGGDEPCLTPSP